MRKTTSVALPLLIASLNLWSQPKPTSLTAEVIGEYADRNPKAGQELTLRIVLYNRSKDIVQVNALRSMGKEQFNQTARRSVAYNHPHAMLAYVDKLSVAFSQKGRTNHVAIVPFPFAGPIPAESYAECLCRVSGPSAAGIYQIGLQVQLSPGVPDDNLFPTQSKPRILRPNEFGTFTIEDFRFW